MAKRATLADKLRGALRPKLAAPTWRERPELLLSLNIPAPMYGLAPRVVLGQKWWDTTRKAAYRSTDYHCLACGIPKALATYHHWLEGHEVYEIDYEAGRMRYLETVPLCHFCHNYIHDSRLTMLLQSGKIHHAKYASVIRHGDRVLRRAGLERPSIEERDALIKKLVRNGRVAEWQSWRLVLFGKLYKPLYKSEEEWRAENGKR